jgi:hypothetical protein
VLTAFAPLLGHFHASMSHSITVWLLWLLLWKHISLITITTLMSLILIKVVRALRNKSCTNYLLSRWDGGFEWVVRSLKTLMTMCRRFLSEWVWGPNTCVLAHQLDILNFPFCLVDYLVRQDKLVYVRCECFLCFSFLRRVLSFLQWYAWKLSWELFRIIGVVAVAFMEP